VFSGSLLVSALLGPAVGRVIDTHGGRGVLALSNLVLAAGLVLLALAQGVMSLVAAWTVLGLGMAMGLYDPAFATLAGLYGRAARGPITGITLIAGFASTVGWPLSALLEAHFGWRGACLVWAALHLLIGLPAARNSWGKRDGGDRRCRLGWAAQGPISPCPFQSHARCRDETSLGCSRRSSVGGVGARGAAQIFAVARTRAVSLLKASLRRPSMSGRGHVRPCRALKHYGR
jgi:MFS family permease